MNHLRVMLYVENVEETAEFWNNNLGFGLAEKVDFGSYQSIILDTGAGFSLQIFQQEFIKMVSPEVSLETPSLMFMADDIQEIHKKLVSAGTFVGEMPNQGTRQIFNFADNEGRYFAISSS